MTDNTTTKSSTENKTDSAPVLKKPVGVVLPTGITLYIGVLPGHISASLYSVDDGEIKSYVTIKSSAKALALANLFKTASSN